MGAKKRAATKPAKTKTKTKTKTPKTRSSKALDPRMLDALVQEAAAVREHAYAPYSRYAVGAAIVTKRGNLFVGCNVENASLGGTICAERGAVMQMIAAGERDPIACAVVSGDDEPAAPCGICRQVLAEFAPDLPMVLVGLGSSRRSGEVGRVVSLADLLPLQFRLTPRRR